MSTHWTKWHWQKSYVHTLIAAEVDIVLASQLYCGLQVST